jgi:putative tryptophan/tyrosine transport system substrate-binding protein
MPADSRSSCRPARSFCATALPSPKVLLERGIPSIAAFRENMEAGALLSYGFDLMELFHDIASYVHQIARGAKPSDIPIEQSPRFYMSVNLKTAAALGVSLPDAFIARANEVIE